MTRRQSNAWMTGRSATLWLLAAFTVCWFGGFLWFIALTRRPPDPAPSHADGIVALTGGPGRVELALHLLAQGVADRLLITGIGGGTDLATLGRLAGIDTAPLAPRITLGRYAASTRGNGLETASWAEQNRIRTLIVVTAAFHMPRALAELRQKLPEVRLLPVPVRPHEENAPVVAIVTLRMEAAEYMKYLLTISGLSQLLPRREAIAGPHPPTMIFA